MTFFPLICALQGDAGWGVLGDSLGLVIDLQVGGMLYVIFSPSGAPYTIHSLPLISFQVTQSLHCTQGVVITGAAEIGQDKGMLPAQDVFPPFFQSASSLSFLVFPFLLMSSKSFLYLHLLHTFHSCLFHVGSFPPHISCSLLKQVALKWKNKSLLRLYGCCSLP